MQQLTQRSPDFEVSFSDLEWLFFSIGREVLRQTEAGNIFPWPEYSSPEHLVNSRWSDLKLTESTCSEILYRLCSFLDVEQLECIGSKPAEAITKIWERWENGHKMLNFSTSGSTGKPKNNIRPVEMMLEEVHTLASILPDCTNIISLVNMHHSYGFSLALLLSRYKKIPLNLLDPLPTTLFSYLKPGTMVIGFPLFWKNMVRYGHKLDDAVSPIYCMCATGPCPSQLSGNLKQLGYSRFLEIYGSSETGSIGLRNDGENAFNLLPYWDKTYKEGSNPLLFHNTAKRSPFVFYFPDYIGWGEDGTFNVLGRIDNAVQVAGVNVYPAKTELLLGQHSHISECTVRLMRPEEGNRLKAFIVPEKSCDISTLRAELKVMLKDLPPPDRPVSFTFGPELPRNEMGKLKDW